MIIRNTKKQGIISVRTGTKKITAPLQKETIGLSAKRYGDRIKKFYLRFFVGKKNIYVAVIENKITGYQIWL